MPKAADKHDDDEKAATVMATLACLRCNVCCCGRVLINVEGAVTGKPIRNARLKPGTSGDREAHANAAGAARGRTKMTRRQS